MAVSVLEPSAARIAGQFLPLSRVRPMRELVEQVGIEFCREQLLVPLWRDGGSVVIATCRPRNVDALREARERLGQPTVVRSASAGEVLIAIDAAVGQSDALSRRQALAYVLEWTQLLRRDQATMYVVAAENEAYLGADLVASRLLTEAERSDAVSLAFHLPSIDVRRHTPRADLDGLLDVATMRALRVLPLWCSQGELYFACDSPPNAQTMEHLGAMLGLLLHPILVAPAELNERLSALVDDETAATGEVVEAARRQRLAPPAQIEAAERISHQMREPITSALQRVAGISPEALQEALARTSGLRVYREDQVEADALALLPIQLVSRLRAAPVQREGRRVVVAMANPWDYRARRGLAALLDAEVQPAIIEEAALARLLERVVQITPTRPLPIGDAHRTATLLVQANFVDPNLSQLTDIDFSQVSDQMLPQLWRALDDRLRTEAVAIDACIPNIDPLLLRPQPEAAAVRPRNTSASDPLLLPLLQDQEVLTVAIASPDAVEPARVLATARQCSIRLAIAREDRLAEAMDDLGGLDLRALSAGYVALGRLMELGHNVERRNVLAVFERMRLGRDTLDEAVVREQLMTAEQFARILGEAVGAPVVSLGRQDRLRTTTNAQGIDITRRVLEDPVNHSVAQLLSIEESQRLGALPVRQDGGTIVVAMADPLDAGAVAALRERLNTHIEVHPATRGDIREASLRAHGRAALGDQLLEAGLVTREQLLQALEVVDRTGVRIGEALISLGLLSEDELSEALARQRGMPFYAVRGLDLDPSVLRLLPEEFARANAMVPVMVDDDGTITLAVADPNNTTAMEAAREILGRPVNFGMTTRSDVRDALERAYHNTYLEHSAAALLTASPEDSAYKVITRPQAVFLLATAAIIVVSVIFWTVPALTVLLALSTGFYLAFSSYKFYLIYRALSHTLEVPITKELVDSLEDRDLPIYTILIPLYRETEVLPILVRGLARMDYPKEKLDVKLLLEEDDVETIAVARLSNLPPYFDITIVPDGQPKGKPKACNYGLLHARGEYVVIYDAEDIPEPDQLKKVLVAFGMSAPNVVCVQTKLNYYNRNQNVLTRWFTTEYSTWFDLFLPGLDASGAPIPLGGTSNHFRLDALRSAGAWDPFNVTEDADLGLRIFKLGGSTVVVDSTTYEEANSVLDNWIRQRSRWVKGYIQTYLVHMRHPIRLMRSLGFGGFISFQLVIGGTFFGFLLNPLLWGLTGIWFATHWSIIQQVFPAPVYYMGAISLYAGNFAFAYMNVAGCLRRRYYSLVKWALLSPVYWVLMSIAAWKGFLQLFYRPFYWEKTVHGLANSSSIDEMVSLSSSESR